MDVISPNNYVIQDFNEFCEVINEIEYIAVDYAKDFITRPTLWFRGHSNSNWSLIPSIQRYKKSSSENILCHSFYHGVSQISDSYIPKKSYNSWLSMMQHYGLPTRLLDWSYSPLVALYFAVENLDYNHIDASITVVIPEFLNKIQGFDPYIYPIDSRTALEMLAPAFYNNMKPSNKILSCFSTSNDLRQYAQRSGFTIHDSSIKIEEICGEKTIYKIKIPSDKKQYFKKTLWSLGIKDSYLFPDIAHVAKDTINRHLK